MSLTINCGPYSCIKDFLGLCCMERLKALVLQLREASPFCSVFPNGLSPVSIYTCEWKEIMVKAEPGQV